LIISSSSSVDRHHVGKVDVARRVYLGGGSIGRLPSPASAAEEEKSGGFQSMKLAVEFWRISPPYSL